MCRKWCASVCHRPIVAAFLCSRYEARTIITPGFCTMSSSKRKFIHIQERPLNEAAHLFSLSFLVPLSPRLFQFPREACPLAGVLPRREAITRGRKVKYGDVRISNLYNIASVRPPLGREIYERSNWFVVQRFSPFLLYKIDIC